jgi:acyl dehydratase
MQIDQVRQSVGREVGVSGWRAVTQEMIDAFAELSDDRYFIHIDPERARRETPFGGTIAHGFLTVSLLTPLVREAVDFLAGPGTRLNYGFNRLRFVAPVRAGRRIRARVTTNAVRDVENGVEIAWGVVVEIEDEPRPALAAEWLIRVCP